MGTELQLIAPESDWSKELLKEYFRYSLNKYGRICPEKETQNVRELEEYQIAQEYLNQTLLILEPLHRDVINYMDSDKMYDLFEKNNDTLYDGNIDILINLLRESKDGLIKQGTSQKRAEVKIEAGPVALCEFAKMHGYGVELA